MRKLRSFALVACICVFAGAVASGCGDSEEWEGEQITFGSLFSTTGDGVPFGPQQVKGAQLAVDELNEDEGINGAEVSLTQRNDESDPATSAEGMRELIDQAGALAVLGPTFSNSAAEADPVANQLKTPVLAVSNTGPGIVGDCDYPCEFIFRNSLGEAAAIPANVNNLVTRERPRNATVLYPEGDDFGRTSARTAARAFREAGVKAKLARLSLDGLPLPTGDRPDTIMITASSGETGAALITDLRSAGYKGSILGGNAFNSPLVARSAGQDGKGVQSAAAWYAGNTSDENQEFIADYRNRYGDLPDQFAAQAYTGVKLLAEAAEDADLKFEDIAADRRTLRDALEKVNEETPLGQFSFTPDHDVIQPIWIVAMDGQGGYTLVEKADP